ncbi:SPOR domain-containing protein [Paracoccus sp. MBLB3053]|uniref:SPOR domain-containing protein n=1 Tax=Paracoccus aurantius TaxID=3073814 RepID=A0ABU2HS97_9RHOB|nr:SPOR domain-containing protein [Paracoccus sp. MBLB3053]MDS9467430.1 SPOR domain-containing protein [Paracoccus sp. MBLB3053]
MWILLGLILWLATAPATRAVDLQPAEMPPADFSMRQYIDSKGCVFLRDPGGRWLPRIAPDGGVICGYPPSLSQRGFGGRPRLSALDPQLGKDPAETLRERLVTAVVTNLREGEGAWDARAMEPLPDLGPEPADTSPIDILRQSLRAAPVLRQGMAREFRPDLRLCELLGYDRAEPVPAGTGIDPAMGYCTGMRPIERHAPHAPSEIAPRGGTAPAMRQPKADRPGRRAKTGQPAAMPVARPEAKEAVSQVLLDPGARYVQIGRYVDAEEAEHAIRRASRLGYPLRRARDGVGGAHLVLAGPFDSRESIIRALDGVQRAGFRDATPR